MREAHRLTLALDTATTVRVGLARDTEVLGRASVEDPRAHAEQLMPTVDRCLAEAGVALADVTHVVVGLGPGPFTGLRAGVVTAQMLAAVRRLPLHGVCSLDVVAAEHARSGSPTTDFLVATDARRRELYWARFAPDGHRRSDPQVSAPADLPDLPAVGPGAELYPDRVRAVPGPRAIDAGLLAALGSSLPDAGHEPLYLRRPDAAEPARRKSVLTGWVDRP